MGASPASPPGHLVQGRGVGGGKSGPLPGWAQICAYCGFVKYFSGFCWTSRRPGFGSLAEGLTARSSAGEDQAADFKESQSKRAY